MTIPTNEINPKVHQAAATLCNRFLSNSGLEKQIAAQTLFSNPNEVPGVGAFTVSVETPNGLETIIINDEKALYVNPQLFNLRGEPMVIINQSGSQ